MTDNPYVVVRLTADGVDYRGKLHADPVRDLETPPEVLTMELLQLLQFDFTAMCLVNEALAQMGDRLLMAEVCRWWCYNDEIGCIRMECARME
jgi:hypothetical protein